jgi:hypothetical protein
LLCVARLAFVGTDGIEKDGTQCGRTKMWKNTCNCKKTGEKNLGDVFVPVMDGMNSWNIYLCEGTVPSATTVQKLRSVVQNIFTNRRLF